MKKTFFSSLFLATLFIAGCSDDSASNGISVQGSDNPQNETSENFITEDMSDAEYSFSLTENFKMDDGYIHIVNESGSESKSVRNWVLSRDYTHLQACGFVSLVKIGENMNFAGLQLFKKDSYDDYQFEVHSDGIFAVRDPKKAILKLSADSSFIEKGKFNRISVQTYDSGNVYVSVNGHLVLTIPKSELAFDLTGTDKIAVMHNVKSTATKAAPAEAWIKTESFEKEKQALK